MAIIDVAAHVEPELESAVGTTAKQTLPSLSNFSHCTEFTSLTFFGSIRNHLEKIKLRKAKLCKPKKN